MTKRSAPGRPQLKKKKKGENVIFISLKPIIIRLGHPDWNAVSNIQIRNQAITWQGRQLVNSVTSV